MGRFDQLLQLDTPTPPSPLPAAVLPPATDQPPDAPPHAPLSPAAEVPANQETRKPANQQTGKPAKQQPRKPANQQTSKLAQKQPPVFVPTESTKEKKKYGTYLREDSIDQIQICAVQTKRKDHEVLQDAVDRYFAALKK